MNQYARKHLNVIFLVLAQLIALLNDAGAQPLPPSVTVYSVDFRTETIFDVPCDQFMTTFTRQLDTAVYRSSDTLRAISSFLQHIHFSRHRDHLDTRARLVFVDNRSTVTVICMNLWDIAVNGRVIRADPTFHRYLLSLVPKVHPHMMPTGP